MTAGADDETLPGVSYVMPVLNEAHYIEAAVTSILAQHYPGPTEIVLALGPSTDGTDAIVERLHERDPRIRAVHNPQAHIPHGLNLAIRECRHPVIVRVDAHAELPTDYTLRAVRTMLRTGAANVGGIMAAVGHPGVQAAAARAYNSPLGLGGGAYHSADVEAGPAESAYLGVMSAQALAEIGGYDESVRRGEDWELNHRLRAAGHLVWLDPDLKVNYWPRRTLDALARQFYSTGVWRGELVRRLRGDNPLRFFAPPVLVLATALSLVLPPLWGAGLLPGWWGLFTLVALAPIAYLLLLIAIALAGGGSFADRVRYAAVLTTMHFAWGTGFIRGAAQGARDAVDTSRTKSD
ncbi:MAG TPA: glycosyltransferase family 2 protein [Jatrophihabitantaceae bacterium]|nr:glycosyltransferase family 2 protein [Jatrophihabitantaceae bacterium]